MASASSTTIVTDASNAASLAEPEYTHAVEIKHLSFKYERFEALHDIDFQLPKGARCCLLGMNGAGKSSLLRLVGGKHMVLPKDAILTLGKPAFRTDNKVEYLGSNWTRTVAFAGYNVQYQADIPVSEMSVELQAEFPERKAALYKLLEVEPTWRMHELSDGQRRRVQLLLGLLRPFQLLVLDEITVDLDVVTRQDFMNFLRQESEERGATIIYATHIFDGLEEWSTHLAYLSYGKLTRFGRLDEDPDLLELRKSGAHNSLLHVTAKWIREDRAKQKEMKALREKEEAALREKDRLEKKPERYLSSGFMSGRFNMGYS